MKILYCQSVAMVILEIFFTVYGYEDCKNIRGRKVVFLWKLTYQLKLVCRPREIGVWDQCEARGGKRVFVGLCKAGGIFRLTFPPKAGSSAGFRITAILLILRGTDYKFEMDVVKGGADVYLTFSTFHSGRLLNKVDYQKGRFPFRREDLNELYFVFETNLIIVINNDLELVKTGNPMVEQTLQYFEATDSFSIKNFEILW